MIKKIENHCLDEALFRHEMKNVQPLKFAPITDSKVPRAAAHVRRTDADGGIPAGSSGPSGPVNSQASSKDVSSYRKDGIRTKVLQKLKRGQFRVGAQLDLHHLNLKSGQQILLQFIAEAQGRNLQCVRIIHGKGLRSEGGPKLKIMTQQVLRDHPQVLAFNACKPADGGSGALDVLLKST